MMILYKKYLWYISLEDVFEKMKIWLGGSASRQLGSAGAFRPDLYHFAFLNKAHLQCSGSNPSVAKSCDNRPSDILKR